MALDASIYAAFAPRQKSALDYAADFGALEGLRSQNALHALRLQGAQGELADANQARQERNALSALLSSPDFTRTAPDAQQRLYRVAPTQAAGVIKSWTEQDKAAADIAKDKAATVKAQGEARADAAKLYRGQLDYISNPQDAARWMQAQYADPVLGQHMQTLGPLEQALARIPQDPEAFGQWRGQVGMGMEKWMEQQRLQGQATETRRHNQATERLTETGQGITLRGQNMVDSRARDMAALTREDQALRRAERADAKKAEGTDKAVTKFSDTLQKEGIPELEKAIGAAEGTLGRYPVGSVPGIGPWKNALPAAAMSDEGKGVRQDLAAIRNIVLNARSGAAVTDQELRRLVEEIGSGIGMSEGDIRRGLTRIRERFDQVKANAAAGVTDDVLETYQQRGGIPIKRGGSGGAGPGSGNGLTLPSADAIAAELARRPK